MKVCLNSNWTKLTLRSLTTSGVETVGVAFAAVHNISRQRKLYTVHIITGEAVKPLGLIQKIATHYVMDAINTGVLPTRKAIDGLRSTSSASKGSTYLRFELILTPKKIASWHLYKPKPCSQPSSNYWGGK